jgi:4-aminobutyrate aminotransferase/(S)-3-amino-2-methylpropionate transaminase
MALTAKNMPYKHSFGPFAPEVYRMPMAYPFRWPTGPERCGKEAAAEVISAIDKQLGAENVACLVIEPIQGEGGFVVPGEGFLPRLAEPAPPPSAPSAPSRSRTSSARPAGSARSCCRGCERCSNDSR